jgi:ribosomal protein L12E/L44/L45/RPP1/RPP2
MGPNFCRTILHPAKVVLLATPEQPLPKEAKGIYYIRMAQDITEDGVGRFTQNMEFSLLCRKDQEPDLPLCEDPKIVDAVNVQLQVELMRLTLTPVEQKMVDEARAKLPKETDKLSAASSQKSAAKGTPAASTKKGSSTTQSPKKSISKSTRTPPQQRAPVLTDVTNRA